MAGSHEDDSPVPLNVTAMIDVIFCLCVFFMCSFHMKSVSTRFETWLPRDRGASGASSVEPSEIRITLVRDPEQIRAVRTLGSRRVDDDDELAGLLDGARQDAQRLGAPVHALVIDSTSDVCWADVVCVLDLGKQARFENIEFADGSSARTPR